MDDSGAVISVRGLVKRIGKYLEAGTGSPEHNVTAVE